jgi:hypothetical protein
MLRFASFSGQRGLIVRSALPPKRTRRRAAVESAKGQKRTHALQQKSREIPIFYRHETLSFGPYGHRAMRLQ